MSYCVNCGVELAASERRCPLCGVEVINPREPFDENGERPEMPTAGQRPEMGERPADGRQPDLGDLPDITPREDTLSAGTAADAAAETDGEALSVRQTLMSVSALALALGIIIAAVFRKKIAL